MELDSGWEIRDAAAAPAPPQPAPPGESEEGAEEPDPPPARAVAAQASSDWRPAAVPGVFDADADPELFGGSVKQYRVRFRAPSARGYRWALHFEQVRRKATVYLNGTRIGRNADPYTPFEVPARGLRRGRVNVLLVTVDNRKDPRLPEGWWNWGGITRPVTLVPRGRRVWVDDLGLMSDVACRGAARRCRASVLVDGVLSRLPRGGSRRAARGRTRSRVPQPVLTVRLRSPAGRSVRSRVRLSGSRLARRRLAVRVRVPRPELWSPERPRLYRASVTLSYRGQTQQVERLPIGLRSVAVKRGLLFLNNRRVRMRGASIHEDFAGRGAALSPSDMDAFVRELQALGANVTRAHYVLSEGMLRRLDRAGIMVWNQAPVWQRDHRANLLQYASERRFAVAQVERTVRAARSHPSVITHAVANELTFTPDRKRTTRLFLRAAARRARAVDPTLPISLDIKGRPGFTEQFTYKHFDMLGINQYFGWYPWVEDFSLLDPFLREMRDNYPDHALVMTEFGAEGRPDMATAEPDRKGSYAFQANHVARTMAVVDGLPWLSGAIHWTLREFEIFPGWRGGAEPQPGPNTRHHKGVLTYGGTPKPAWSVLRERYLNTPLYP